MARHGFFTVATLVTALAGAAAAVDDNKVCRWVGASAGSDAWCNSNCNHNPPHCPADACACTQAAASPAQPSGSCRGNDSRCKTQGATHAGCKALQEQGSDCRWHHPAQAVAAPRHTTQTAFPMSGATDFAMHAAIATRQDGVIFGRALPTADGHGGLWANGGSRGQGKMLFIRRGKVCFDVGWVGFICGRTAVADGQPHTVGVQFSGGRYHVSVDGAVEASGLRATKDRAGDVWVRGERIGHAGQPGSMSRDFAGTIDDTTYASRPYVEGDAPNYCSSWGDPHVVQFRRGGQGSRTVVHTQVKGTFTLFSYLHPATGKRVTITTVQDKPNANGRGPAFNTRVTMTVDDHGPGRAVVYDLFAGGLGGAAAATEALNASVVTASTHGGTGAAAVGGAATFPWPRSVLPGRFDKVVSFRGGSLGTLSAAAPVKLHIAVRGRGSWKYLDVGIEFYGNVSATTGLCDGSLPPCEEGCSSHTEGVCHCTTPPDKEDTCDALETCCSRAKDAALLEFPFDPLKDGAYRSCMEDGFHLGECCEDGADPSACCGESIPEDCRVDDYCDCGIGQACDQKTGFCDAESPLCMPPATTTSAPPAATTTAPAATPTAPTWKKWSGDWDLEGGALKGVASLKIGSDGSVSVGASTGQLRASTSTRCPGQPCVHAATTGGLAVFVALVDAPAQEAQEARASRVMVAAYTQDDALVVRGPASARVEGGAGGCTGAALAAQQKQALDALQATQEAVAASMRAMLGQMKEADLETAALEEEGRRLQAASAQAGC